MKRQALYKISLAMAAMMLAGTVHAQSKQSRDNNQSKGASAERSLLMAQRSVSFRLMPREAYAGMTLSGINPFAAPNPVVGSGSAGRLAKWTGVFGSNTYSLGESAITEDKFGKIGIGTVTPTSPLTVAGLVEVITPGGGIKFPDGTIQTTSATGALFSIPHDTTLTGNGTAGSPLGVAVPLFLRGTFAGPIMFAENQGNGGAGMSAFGGPGGTGVFAIGGLSVAIVGGRGMSAHGGASVNNAGGAGLEAFGGSSDSNFGGPGIVAFAGGGPMGDGLAGEFNGDVDVTGMLSKGGGSFRIDHPLRPETSYLSHSFVESPDMMNIYNGNITTDENGEAVVTLPDYFEVLNQDFRYQLTVVGTFAQAIVAKKVKDNRFVIRTSAPGVEVSWQVTGIRHDPWAKRNRIRVEVEKSDRERGYYLHPEAYDQPNELNIQYLKHPEMIKQRKNGSSSK